jgi:pimeloyl-ACP methyl ester carboxylesterase
MYTTQPLIAKGVIVSQEEVISPQPGHYVNANGLDVYYEEVDAGAPLILLHGGTVTSARWQPQLPAFARHFRVITPDSRGHGRTNNPAGVLSYRLMADDMAALVQALGLDAPLICGYSDGGQIALEIGMRYPDLAAALVVGGAKTAQQQQARLSRSARLGRSRHPSESSLLNSKHKHATYCTKRRYFRLSRSNRRICTFFFHIPV